MKISWNFFTETFIEKFMISRYFVVLSSWLIAIARVHPVHLMNADWAPGGCQVANPRPSQPTWAVSPPITASYRPHPPSPFIVITQPQCRYLFYRPTQGRRLSRPKHCRKVQQPMPKTAYRTSCHDMCTDGGVSHYTSTRPVRRM